MAAFPSLPAFRDNAAMIRLTHILITAFLLFSSPAQAWNAAGHRIVAAIAWQQLDPDTRSWLNQALQQHPDADSWRKRAKSEDAEALFYEAATWPDDIRNDPRYYDEGREEATPAIKGLIDQARHKDWHYVDLDPQGKAVSGQLPRRLRELRQGLASSNNPAYIRWALPWLLHLVGDLHQPLHIGQHGDEGGNAVEIENPYNPRQPFTNLHTYWDDLPGPPWLRGKRLEARVRGLLERYPAPRPASIDRWIEESHTLLRQAYPNTAGSLLLQIDEAFRQESQKISERQLVAAGYRLGTLLNEITSRRVPRETP